MSTVSVTYTHGADLDMLAVSLGSIMSSELLICRKIDTFVPGPRETGLSRAVRREPRWPSGGRAGASSVPQPPQTSIPAFLVGYSDLKSLHFPPYL